MKIKSIIFRLSILVLCLCVIIPNFSLPTASAEESTSGITPGTVGHIADTKSSDDYKDLIDLRDESRRAGRVWADKSVFSEDIHLDMDSDGIENADGSDFVVMNGSDFLHEFSALGSSQSVKTIQALDVVFIMDTSASMSSTGENQFLQNGTIEREEGSGIMDNGNPRLEYAVDSLNTAIGQLMNSSDYNRISLVSFDTGARTVLPLGRYAPSTVDRESTQSGGLHNGEDRYLTVAQCSNMEDNINNGQGIYYNRTYYDDRFPQAYDPSASPKRFLDGNGLDADWKIVEINAVPEGGDTLNIDTSSGRIFKTKDNNQKDLYYIHTSSGTDTSVGYLEGMHQLTSVSDTKLTLYKDNAGNLYDTKPNDVETTAVTIQRQPVLVMLTDGAPNANGSNAKGYPTDWWQGTTFDSTNRYIRRYDAANGIMVAATAAYLTQQVEMHYFCNGNANSLPASFGDYQTLIYNIGLCLDDPDSSVADTAADGQIALAGLNPSSLEDSTLKNKYKIFYDSTSTGNGVINYWDKYKSGQNVTLQGKNGNWTMKHPSGTDSVTKQQAKDITSLDYPTEFRDVRDPDKLPEVFDELIGGFMTDPFTPVSGPNDAGYSSSLTYMDPIGKYMEIKNVKNLLLFGKMYDITPDGDDKVEYYNKYDEPITNQTAIENGEYAYSIRHYRIVTPASGDRVINPSYGANSEIEFKLSDIEIYVKHTDDYQDEGGGDSGMLADIGGDQTLYVNIPANALPIQLVTITLDTDDNFLGYATNVGLKDRDTTKDYIAKKKQSTPLRLFYDVGISDEIKTANNNVDLTKVDPDYVTANQYVDEEKDERWVYFYSNWYNPNKDIYDGYVADTEYTFGDAVLTFSAGSNNRYYMFEDDRLLFNVAANDENVEGGQITKNGADYYLNGEKLTMVTELDHNKQYYVMIEYYDRQGLVQYALPRLGSEFGAGLGEGDTSEYLCWYNPTTKDAIDYINDQGQEVDRPAGNDYFLAAKKGGLRVGDMSAGIGIKNNVTLGLENKTGTAETYYMPTISSNTTGDRVTMNLYLGNNGRCAVSNTQLLITKTVDSIGENDADDDTSVDYSQAFNYTIQLTGMNDGSYPVINAIREEITDDKGNKTTRWRALIDKIELLTNNDGFLMKGSPQLAIYTDPKTNQEYYIYVGGRNAAEGFTHVFFDKSQGHSFTEVLGNDSTLKTKVYLVPTTEYDDEWVFDEEDTALVPKDDFQIGEVSLNTIGFAVSIPYDSTISYDKQELTFNNGIASFTLKDGEGILFNGLDSGTVYTVTEELTEDQVKDGITLKNVVHRENDTDNSLKESIYKGNAKDSDASDESDSYNFDFANHKYTVTGNTTSVLTEEVNYFNYSPKQMKKETAIKDGTAEVGDSLEYEIYWENYAIDENGAYTEATITINDPLDVGVDFVEANYEDITLKAGQGNIDTDDVKISYNSATRTVKWEIEADAASYGTVYLTAQVNENADKSWDGTGTTPGNDNDYAVINKCTVDVGNQYQSELNTNTVRTIAGLSPHKTETEIYDSEGVLKTVNNITVDAKSGNLVGPEVEENGKVTYSISYANYKEEKATITVTDKLDPGVNFVSASGNGTYHGLSHTVTWVIEDVEAFAVDNVTLTVQVNEDAVYDWHYTNGLNSDSVDGNYDYKIFNRASVQVDNDAARVTETVENPIDAPLPVLDLPDLPVAGGMGLMPIWLFGGGMIVTGVITMIVQAIARRRYHRR